MMAGAMIADSFAMRCLARAGIGYFFMMTARTISAVYCLAKASASGFFVVMTATISAICCLARAGASGNFVVMTARTAGNHLQNAPHLWFGAGRMGLPALGRLEGLPLMRHRLKTHRVRGPNANTLISGLLFERFLV